MFIIFGGLFTTSGAMGEEYKEYFPYKPFTPANKTMIAYFVVDENGQRLVNVPIKDEVPAGECTPIGNNTYNCTGSIGWTWENRTNEMGFSIEFVGVARNPANVSANGVGYHFNIPGPPNNGTTHVYYITLKPDGSYILKDYGYYNLAGKKITFLAVYNGTNEANGKIAVGNSYFGLYNGMGIAIANNDYTGNITIQAEGRNIAVLNDWENTRSTSSSYGSLYLNLKDIATNETSDIATYYHNHKTAIIVGGGLFFLFVIFLIATKKSRRSF